MKLEVFESTEALASIQEHWASLFHRSEYATPFQSPAWLLTWWSHYGSGNLHVITGWENGQLRAILPCFKHRWHGRSQCTLIGSGISDYLDPVVDPPCCAAFISGLSKHLNSFEWHVCDWQDLAADTPLRELPGFAAIDQVPCTIIPLRGTFESFWSARSADLRRNVRRYTARAEESGKVAFEAVDGPNPELLEHLIRLHTRRWRAHGEPGMVAVHRLAPFLREIVARLSLDGMVRYFLIRFSGEIAAILVAFIHRNEVFAYMSAFDPEYESFGFGRKLLYESLRTSYESGHSVWNFLRGDEPYKLSWGAELMPRCRIRLER